MPWRPGTMSWKDQPTLGLSSVSGTMGRVPSSGQLDRIWRFTGAGKSWGATSSWQRAICGPSFGAGWKGLSWSCSAEHWGDGGEKPRIFNCYRFSAMVTGMTSATTFPANQHGFGLLCFSVVCLRSLIPLKENSYRGHNACSSIFCFGGTSGTTLRIGWKLEFLWNNVWTQLLVQN